MKRSIAGLLLVAFALGLAGCGDKSEKEKEAEAASKVGANEITCDGAALSGDSGLAAGFPKPSNVTYVKTRQDGPTTVVNAYFEGGDLDAAFSAYKDAFEPAGYDVPFNEKEEDDAEVSFEKSGGTTGLVALKAACDNGRISIRITSRAD